MADDTTFEGHPVSLGEVRAGRAMDASLWTPREGLIWLLREMDEGRAKPDELVVLYSVVDDDGMTRFGHVSATKSINSRLGLIENCKFELVAGNVTRPE